MRKTDLIKLVISGEKPPRLPYSFWSHFPSIDLDAKSLAEASYTFYQDLDLDFIKSMPNGMFSIQDWGAECDFSQITCGGVARVLEVPVKTPQDWGRLEELDINTGSMGRELSSLKLLLELVDGEAPLLATVFSPLTTAYKLSGGKVLEHIQSHPAEVKSGLELIAETTCRFTQAAVDLGCAGIFLANQMCTSLTMTPADYSTYCKPYDLEVLKAAQIAGWFNAIHVHGTSIMLDQVLDYPTHGISYHVWETPPNIEYFLTNAKDKILIGGLQRTLITDCRPMSIMNDILNTYKACDGRRLILAPGCTIRHPFETWMLKSIIACIQECEEQQKSGEVFVLGS